MNPTNPDQLEASIKNVINKGLPEVDFFVSAGGITVSSDRLITARYVPFDVPGKCVYCKCDGIEIDFAVTSHGVTFICARMKGIKHVLFDKKQELSKHCFFRVKCKGKVFNIPMDGASIDKESSLTPIKEEEKAVESIKKKIRLSTPIPEIKKEKADEISEEVQEEDTIF